MTMRRILTLALLGAVLLSGCTAPVPKETAVPSPGSTLPEVETLEFALPYYPGGGFHPITGENRVNLTLAPLLYRGLFTLDRQFRPQEELCSGYTVSENGLVWNFRLTQAVFSDGSPLTAEEVTTCLELARRSPRYAARLADISRVTAGEGEVIIALSQPNGALPVLLDVPIVKETEDPQRPLGTGPYVLTGEGSTLALRAREGEQVPVEEIPLRSIRDSDDLVQAFDAREISLVDTDLTGTDALGYSGWLETTDYPTTGLVYVGYNVRTGPCREQAVRQAAGYAADRERMAGTLLAGHAVAACLPVHPNTREYDETLASEQGYNMETARVILAGAHWQWNEEGVLQRGREVLTLRLLVNQDSTYKISLAEALADGLRTLGCQITVEKLPWDDFLNALERGEFDLYLGETVLPADFDLEELVTAGGSLNYGGYADGEAAALLSAFRSANGQERSRAGQALWGHLAHAAPLTPLCFKNGSLLTQWGQVKGAEPTCRDVFAGLENWTLAGG